MRLGAPGWLDKRIGTLTLVVAILVLCLVLAFDSIASIRAQKQAIAVLAERTRMLEDRAAALTRAQPQGQDDPATPTNWSLGGETSGLASAEFQRTLATLAERAGALVRTLDMRESDIIGEAAATTTDRLVRLRLEADMEVIEQKLPDLLYAIEASLPLMMVDSLTLRPNRAIGSSAGANVGSERDRPLNLRLAVSAFWAREVQP